MLSICQYSIKITNINILIEIRNCCYKLSQECDQHVSLLVKPVLPCFNDSDSRIRYYALESIYNIVKVYAFLFII